MPDFLRYTGIGVIAFAIIAPMAHCEIKNYEQEAEIRKICLEKNGEWGTGWGTDSCKLPALATNTGDTK